MTLQNYTNVKPFLSNCAMCNEPVIRNGDGCPCKCHNESFKRYLKNKEVYKI